MTRCRRIWNWVLNPTCGVTGWVRNTPDGAVELVAEGDADRLRRLLSWCDAGPPGARVTQVAHEWRPFAGEFDGFCLRR